MALGDGFCRQGRAAELERAEEAGSDINALIDFGNIISGDVSHTLPFTLLPPFSNSIALRACYLTC